MKKQIFYAVIFFFLILCGVFTFYIYYQDTYVYLDKSLIDISVDNDYWTSKDVEVTVTYQNKDIKVKSYSFDGGETWQSENTYTASENQVLKIILKTSNDRKSGVVTYRVENIDKDAPVITVDDTIYVAQGSEFSFDNRYSIIDLASGIKGNIRIEPSEIDTTELGSYEVEFYAIDRALNSTTKKVTVEVLDAEDPLLKEDTSNQEIAVTGIKASKTKISLVKGTTETLTATVKPSNATNKKIIWSSSNETVAMVDQTGKVTAIQAGSTTITATTEDGNKASDVKVIVTNEKIEAQKIELDSKSADVTTDHAPIVLTATISPENTTDTTIKWNSSNPNVAIVVNGTVTIKGEGITTITATTSNGKVATYSLTVSDRYTFAETEIRMDTGELMGYTIKIYKNGVDITKDVTTITSPFTARNESGSDEISITMTNHNLLKSSISFNYNSKKLTAYK